MKHICLTFILLFTLGGCGNSPKLDPPKEGKPKDQILPCSPNYDPLNIQRSDLLPIQDLSTLPNGKYAHQGIELFFRMQSTLSKQVVAVGHFAENIRDGGIALETICKSNVSNDLLAIANFFGLKLYTQLEKKEENNQTVIDKNISYVRFLATIENGKMNIGRVLNDTAEKAGLEKLVQEFSAWRLYQVKINEYELRARRESLEGTNGIVTTIVQKISFTPL